MTDDRVRHRAVLIGVTGPIGCGKSQVGRWLAKLGATTVDADRIAREVTAPGTALHDSIIALFGPSIVAADGTVDRAALGRLVFADPASLRSLEALVHPEVRPRILAVVGAAEAAGATAVVIEAIKLVESGLAALCDEIWLVTCDPAVQRERLVARGTPGADADQRIAAQAGLRERLRPSATRVIDTSGGAGVTRALVKGAFAQALASAGSSAGTPDPTDGAPAAAPEAEAARPGRARPGGWEARRVSDARRRGPR